MKLYVKLVAIAAALGVALFLTIHSPSSKSLKVFGEQETLAAPGKPTPKSQYDLTALKIFNVTLVRLRDNYVDPTRIDTKQMLLKALEQVQLRVAEVMVEPHPAEDKVVVTVNDQKKTFDLKDVDSPWRLATRLKEIFKFVQSNMNPGSDARQIEYAAVNGMLSTLDPHSTLLDPDAYKEMRVNTSQKFGGLGIVIGIRKDKLTVINPMPNTPAATAGIVAGDHIVRIDDEATINLTLTEAVNRLRGDPDTNVVVWVERKGKPGDPANGGLLKFPLTRAEIHVDSVADAKLLKGNVGYFKVKQFGATTADEVHKAMVALKKQGAKAFVIDLRWNPGGLLDQAIKMSNLFIDKGVIVTTVGYAGKQRDERKAIPGNADTTSPLAVILNGGSASASEIVAGALKNDDRAVIVGQTSFGKGSVQVLFDNDDDSALKLTIAQYLTPGDISIQSVGIPPDVALLPARIPDQMASEKDRVHFLAPSHLMKESDLEGHLDHETAKKGKADEEVVYLYQAPPKKPGAEKVPDDEAPEPGMEGGDDGDDEPAADTDNFFEDFEIQFARDLVAQAHSANRKDIVAQSKGFIARRRADEEGKISTALTKLGVNWERPVGKPAAPNLRVAWSTDHPGDALTAGDTVHIKAQVTNDGTTPAWQVRGIIKTDDYTFDDTEFLFGLIKPGETKSFENVIKVPKESVTRLDSLKLEVKDSADHAAIGPAPLKMTLTGMARPIFGYTYQVIDDVRGNGDGLVQRGEEVRLFTAIHNLGQGKSWKTLATLKNNSGDGIVVNKGRFDLGEIEPNADKSVDFTFEVHNEYEGNDFQVEVMVYDETLREYVNEKITIPIAPAAPGPTTASGFVKIGKDATVYEGARLSSVVIGKAPSGGVFRLLGREQSWLRIEVVPGRPGFVDAKDVSVMPSGAVAAKFVPRWAVTPPKLALKQTALEVDGASTVISGTASDDRRVEDVYIFVSNRGAKIEGKKVYYSSNKASKNGADLAFTADVPLWSGNNVFTVVARENNEVQTRQTYIVYRPEAGSAQATAPKTK